MIKKITSLWYSNNILAYFLLPFSFCYCLIIKIRRFLYRIHFKKTQRFPVPVIIVGNLTVGGTGKTPLVIWLVKFLQQQGFKPGIVSRGYGGKSPSYPQIISADSDAEMSGDEAILLAQATERPVVIDPRRVEAVRKLLQESDCNIVISDDGLQHYALSRDIEICVIDGGRRFGNQFCLPAGPLREPLKRLAEVDFIVANGQGKAGEYAMRLLPGDFCSVAQKKIICSPMKFKNKTIHAVAGIGNPSRFFHTLRMLDLIIIEHPYPDHYLFQKKDFNFADPDSIILMTEKDAVKCRTFADQRFWYLPVQAELPIEFGERLLEKLNL
jgi:tetraacyldisaccharide 4'-kinase